MSDTNGKKDLITGLDPMEPTYIEKVPARLETIAGHIWQDEKMDIDTKQAIVAELRGISVEMRKELILAS